MPAISLSKLREDVGTVALSYGSETQFIENLIAVFTRYGNIAYKEKKEPVKIRGVEYFNTPVLLTNQLLLQLGPLVEQNPGQAETNLDRLWNSKYYEFKQLALHLLRILSVKQPGLVIDLIHRWLAPGLNSHLVDELFENGASHLMRYQPEQWQQLVTRWLNSDSLEGQKTGLAAARALAKSSNLESFPAIYAGITRLVLLANSNTFYELLQLLIVLAERSPAETTYFMHQIIGLGLTENSMRLFRKVISAYPESEQPRLRKMLSGY